jgi:hypothetical protein
MPQINPARKELFDPKRNLNKENINTKKFMSRLENARYEEKLKRDKLNSNSHSNFIFRNNSSTKK